MGRMMGQVRVGDRVGDRVGRREGRYAMREPHEEPQKCSCDTPVAPYPSSVPHVPSISTGRCIANAYGPTLGQYWML
eukprot:3940665-Rhodomonas_salina.2